MYDGKSGDFIEVLVQDDPATPKIDESGGLLSAHGLLFGPDGNLYVASFGTDEVLRYDDETGDFIDVFVNAGNGLNGPTALLFVAPAVPGDLNGDGVVGVADLLILFAEWGPCADCDDCPADLSGDCTVGIADLLILFSLWG